MPTICQTEFPDALRKPLPLPRMAPLDPSDWLVPDEAYAGQMRYKRQLVTDREGDVLASCDGSDAAQREVLGEVLTVLRERVGYEVHPDHVICPDGVAVSLDQAPLKVLSTILQDDLCIMECPADADEHVLTAAVLCFPASWTLAEKIGRPLMRIHKPVAEYDEAVGKRVQRFFDGVKVGRPLWRFNRLWYSNPDLHQPRSETDKRAPETRESYQYLRMEKQSMVRMPRTGAVVFSIHTYLLPRERVPEDVVSELEE